MFDLLLQLQAIHRATSRRPGAAGEFVSVQVRRTYDAPITDVWSALTDRARLARWMFPIEGELRVGGSFQFQGNAGGDILACEPPHLLRVTYGGPTSTVEIRLAEVEPGPGQRAARGAGPGEAARRERDERDERGAGATELVLEHTVPIEIARSVAGALFVGPGWDTGLVALDLHLRGTLADAAAFHKSREVQDLGAGSISAWATTAAAAGASDDEIAALREIALAHFAPDAPRS